MIITQSRYGPKMVLAIQFVTATLDFFVSLVLNLILLFLNMLYSHSIYSIASPTSADAEPPSTTDQIEGQAASDVTRPSLSMKLLEKHFRVLQTLINGRSMSWHLRTTTQFNFDRVWWTSVWIDEDGKPYVAQGRLLCIGRQGRQPC